MEGKSVKKFKYVIIGGGVSSTTAIMGIREHDAEGSIALVRDEPTVPYDRPPLSKGFLRLPEMSLDDVSSKFDNFYPDNGVELMTGTSAEKINLEAKTIKLSDGNEVEYEKLLLSTGARANRMTFSGADHANAFNLRTIADAEGIREKLLAANSVVLLGAGYIAVEVAGTALKAEKAVTVVAPDPYPWSGFATADVGNFVKSYLEEQGVNWYLGNTIDSYDGETCRLSDGTILDAPLLVFGTGVYPNIELAELSGIKAGSEGIHADQKLQTSDPDVYTCGDVAYLYDPRLKHQWRTEHHLHAKWTGQVAGANMAGAGIDYDRVPYFWSDFHNWSMILRGYPGAYDATYMIGDPKSGNFVELYLDSNNVVRMGIALNQEEPKLDPISDLLEEIIKNETNIEAVDETAFQL